MKITITTNIPALIVTLWDGHLIELAKKKGDANATIPYFKQSGEAKSVETKIVFDDMPRGLYSVRMSLPYYNLGTLFEMPVVMDEIIELRDKDVELTFNASLQTHK